MCNFNTRSSILWRGTLHGSINNMMHAAFTWVKNISYISYSCTAAIFAYLDERAWCHGCAYTISNMCVSCVYMVCQDITCEPQNRWLFGTRKRLVNGGKAEFNQETYGYRHLRIWPLKLVDGTSFCHKWNDKIANLAFLSWSMLMQGSCSSIMFGCVSHDSVRFCLIFLCPNNQGFLFRCLVKSAGAAWARTIPSFILNTYQSHLGETYGMTSHMTRRINLGGGTDVSLLQ